MVQNIFLFFMNEELLKFIRYFEKIGVKQEMEAKENMLQFSLLSTSGICLIPPSFLMENPSNLKLLLKYEYFFEIKKISLLIKETSINDFFKKKEIDYRNVKEEKGYIGYYDNNTKECIENLYNLSYTVRGFSISSILRDYWENELAEKKQLIGFSGNDSKIILNNESLIAELEAISYHTEDKAFIWDNIQHETKNFDENLRKAVWESLLLYYIKAHIENQNCLIIENNPLLSLNYNKLPLEGLIPYPRVAKYLEGFYSSINHVLPLEDFKKLYNSDTKKSLPKKIKNKQLAERIHSDVDDDHITGSLYLGTKPTKEEATQNLKLPIFADGLDSETAQLLLSALPKNSQGMYLSPLKKGMSGANVYAVTIILGAERKRSKTYVAKIGDRQKLEIEYQNYDKYIQPYLPNYSPAIWREKNEKYALFYEFKRNKNKDKNVSSLKEKILSPAVTCDEIINYITQTFEYLDEIKKRRIDKKTCSYHEILNWYTSFFISESKSNEYFQKILGVNTAEVLGLTAKDEDLKSVLKDINFVEVFSETSNKVSKQIIDVVHGDLHAENIIVGSDRNTWLIDFYWTNETNPIVDYVMLEISIKFACIPHYADFNIIARYENIFAEQFWFSSIPEIHGHDGTFNLKQITKAYKAINHIRKMAKNKYKVMWKHYRDILFLMTCGQLTKVRWNMMNIPFVILSSNLLASRIKNIKNR